ncbi:hypothetical protein B1B04_18820 [Lysinibacillus sp. KCTC 33748]|uniref:hypothetical protein n=1 Tax=unclassified Lysinibacillus TaxID=2636778 RepID=UPI0009A8B5B5|nr:MULTISPECIES: hypothetical protein [unclassified Lysinibacillus]OXS70217.1 hypothetical protein B1B04_18820 [Lysinibacillus sp. KCTC 33748]SKC04784.1 hypothetical protein SAMN06295926_11953 [Lysinibacillus sp. AC-3]
MKKVLEVILCFFVGVFLFGIFAITFQVIGGDSTNKAAIIGGVLSMLGGAIGAFGAYFIARWQMNVLLERQYEKEKNKLAWEIRVNKKLEVVQILNNKINDLDLFWKEYTSHSVDLGLFLERIIAEDPEIKEIELSRDNLNKGMKFIEKLTDFVFAFKIFFSYKSFYSEDFLSLLNEIEDDLIESYTIIIELIPHDHLKIEYSTEEFFNNWFEEKAELDKEIHELNSKFNELLEHLISEISEMLPSE